MSKYSNSHEEITNAIKTLGECIDNQALGPVAKKAVVTILKELVSKEWDVYYAIKDDISIDGAINQHNASKKKTTKHG